MNIVNKLQKKIRRATALLLVSSLCLVSCRSQLIATTMELNKTEGTVNIHDRRQKEIEPREQLDLYSGYQVETLQTSYAWINLDKVKLTKMDAQSEIEIAKRRNDLEIMVHSGKLFFHVTEPLADDESLNIRTSSMVVGVRGTCGWVEAPGENQMRVYVLEGTIGCWCDKDSVDGQAGADSLKENLQDKLSLKAILDRYRSEDEDEQVYVSAGEMAEMTLSPEGEEQIIVSEFTVADIPDYVMEELLADEELQQKILEESGLDIRRAPEETPGQDNETFQEETPEEASFFLNSTVYYGDLDKCRLTSDQARLFAHELQTAIESGQSFHSQFIVGQDELASYPFQSYAILYDAGDGIPGMFFSCGGFISTMDDPTRPGIDTVLLAPVINQTMYYLGEPAQVYHTGLDQLFLGDGYLFGGGIIADGSSYEGAVYPLVNGQMQRASTMASAYYDQQSFQVDWAPASEADFNQWKNTWEVSFPIGYTHANDIGGSCWGMVPAQEVLDALNNYAGQE